METSNSVKSFLQLRPSKIIVRSEDCDRLLRFESAGHDMDHLVRDFQTALDETARSNINDVPTRSKSWKRKCKSTSNLVHASDDSSSSVDYVGLQSRDKGTSSLQLSDSDIEPGCHGMRTELARTGRNREDRLQEYRSRRGGADHLGMESDSYTENISPAKKYRGVNTKRKRKIKRMAVEPCIVPIHLRNSGGKATNRKNLRSWPGAEARRTTRKKAAVHVFLPGKRKRSARGKSVESEEISVSSRGASQDDDDRMEMEEFGSSSSLSSSEREWVNSDRGEGPEEEADDEQSDWPGPEPGISTMQLSDEEINPEISFSGLLPLKSSGKPLRLGDRRLKGQSTRSAGLGAEFAMPGIPTSRNYLQLRERKGKDNKRQRRSPPSLPSRAMSARGKSGTQWSKYYCGSKSN